MVIRPTGKIAGFSNIFHATIGKDIGRIGDRYLPSFFFRILLLTELENKNCNRQLSSTLL